MAQRTAPRGARVMRRVIRRWKRSSRAEIGTTPSIRRSGRGSGWRSSRVVGMRSSLEKGWTGYASVSYETVRRNVERIGIFARAVEAVGRFTPPARWIGEVRSSTRRIRTTSDEEGQMAESVYRVTEVIGTSPDSWEKAAKNAV